MVPERASGTAVAYCCHLVLWDPPRDLALCTAYEPFFDTMVFMSLSKEILTTATSHNSHRSSSFAVKSSPLLPCGLALR